MAKDPLRSKQTVILGVASAKDRMESEKRMNKLFDEGWKISRFEAAGESFFLVLVRASRNQSYQAQRNG